VSEVLEQDVVGLDVATLELLASQRGSMHSREVVDLLTDDDAEVLEAHAVDALVNGRDELDERDRSPVEDIERLGEHDQGDRTPVPDVLGVRLRMALEKRPLVDVQVPIGDADGEVAERVRCDVDAAGNKTVALHRRKGSIVPDDLGDRIRRRHVTSSSAIVISLGSGKKELMVAGTVATVRLNNGVEMPVLGFGVFQIPADQTAQAVLDALETGYRSLDTARSYMNEEAVGSAIAASDVTRDELFITTKLWVEDQGEEKARRAFEASLGRLGLDYVDLYLIHQPFGDYYGSWRAMEKLNSEGLARAIGVSNFYPDRFVDLIEHNETAPAINQIECHLFIQRVDYQELMRERGVQIESWGRSRKGGTSSFPTRCSLRSAPPTASPSLRSCCVG
jgi:diketogulonate reductase-like aldo/keto reductase